MPFAVEIFFDDSADKKLCQLRGSLARQVGAPDKMGLENIRPHISLALFEQGQLAKILAVLQNLASRQASFEVSLTALNSFPGDEGVLYLEPDALGLGPLQRDCFQGLQGLSDGWNRFYHPPENLVFHCTMNLYLSPSQIQQSLRLDSRSALPIKARAVGLALVEVVSGEVLGEFALSEKK
jgi:hypothetical protein